MKLRAGSPVPGWHLFVLSVIPFVQKSGQSSSAACRPRRHFLVTTSVPRLGPLLVRVWLSGVQSVSDFSQESLSCVVLMKRQTFTLNVQRDGVTNT